MGPKQVYLLDEPTTGLDSSTAQQVVRTIGEFAHMDGVRLAVMPITSKPNAWGII